MQAPNELFLKVLAALNETRTTECAMKMKISKIGKSEARKNSSDSPMHAPLESRYLIVT
jgi:hypothetical protein